MDRFKVVEVATVTDEELETVINEWVAKGYTFDGIRFAMHEASRRPSMAFLFFTQGRKAANEKG